MEFGVGSVQEGKVTGITKFGAFVSLPGGRSGLVHISEIAYSYVNDVKDYLADGQDVKVKVIGIDDAGRINLSIKKAMDPPPRPASGGPAYGGGRFQGGGDRRSAPSPRPSGGYVSRSSGPREPADFEDRLKQFMQSSDSRLSDLRTAERRSSRRGNRSR